jgi:biopolymer transport protein ExbB
MRAPRRTGARLAAALAVLLAAGLSGAEEPASPAKATPAAGAAALPAEEAEEPAPAAGAAMAAKQPETLLEFAVAGGWLMIPIALSSILGLAFLVERLIHLRTRKVLPPALMVGARALIREKPLDRARAGSLVQAHPSAAASVLGAALERLDQDREEITAAVNEAAAREVYDLRRNLRAFAVIASVAPLLGLLGTVTGLIQCFREVAMSGLGSGASLAPGMYEALITTAGGLFVAIPSLLVYYWFTARIDHYVHEIDLLVADFVEAHRVRPAYSMPAA